MDEFDFDEEEDVTAYHEAGHAVIGCALGARIERVRLWRGSCYDEPDDGLPDRFGDCLVNWGRVDPGNAWQLQKELLTILAGPVAQWIYENDSEPSMEQFATWEQDWREAQRCVAKLHAENTVQARLLREAISRLKKIISSDRCWPAVAAVADELMTGEEIDGQRVQELVRYWWR